MPSFVLYPFAILGLVTVLSFAALLVLVLLDQRRSNDPGRAVHRRKRD